MHEWLSDRSAGRPIPQASASISTAGKLNADHGAEGNAGDRAIVTQGRPDSLTGFDIPQARRAIRSGKDDNSPVRAQGRAGYRSLRHDRVANWFACLTIP